MTELQTIREACIKANPEIVELKFGCWIETKNNGLKMITKIEYGDYFSAVSGGSLIMVPKNQIQEIIGRPIRLADVLLAVKKEKVKELLSPELKKISEFWEVQKIIDIWNLKDDNLENQSEETIDFIISLLRK